MVFFITITITTITIIIKLGGGAWGNESWEVLSDAVGKLAPNCIGDSDEERNQRDDERDEADGAHDVGTVRMEYRGKNH